MLSQTPAEKIVIIGAGQAAATAIASLRKHDYLGEITLIGDETVLPYQRPPLSKDFLKGELAEERLYFKKAPWYKEHRVKVILGVRAIAIDRHSQYVSLDQEPPVPYDVLIIATGSRPRKLTLPGVDLNKVFDLRSLDDVGRIQPSLVCGQNLIVIGAGYIGLEAAATANQLGVNVTVLEYAPRVLERVTSPEVSRFYQAAHHKHGVVIQTGARLKRFTGVAGEVTGAELEDGTHHKAAAVLIGIGIVPNTELASEAGIDCDNGISVDRDARTSDPSVYAIGDCSYRPLVHYHRKGRLESVHNAIEQGRLAAAAIMNQPRPVEDCPWFWSNQYDLKLQIAGLSAGYTDSVVRGDPESDKFAVFYLHNGKLISTDAINSPVEFMLSKKLIISGATINPATLADTSVSMKEIAAAILA